MAGSKGVTIWTRTYVCIFFANCFLCLSQQIVNPLITTYGAWLGAGTVLIGFMSGLYYGIAFMMRPVSGPAITMIDHKKLLIISYGLGVLVNMMYALFASVPMFIVARIIHGIEFSVVGSLMLTMAGDALPPEKLGSGLGIYGVGAAVSTAIGPTVGLALRSWGNTLLGDGGGYKVSFLVAAGVMAVAMIPCILAKPERKNKEELKNAGPWYKNIIAVPSIPPACIVCMISMAHSLYTAYLVPFAAENGFANIGTFFTVYAIVMLLARPLCGKLSDKKGATAIIVPGLCCYAVSFVIIYFSKSMLAVYAAAVFAAVGYSAAMPAGQTLCIQSMPGIKRGVASNTNYFGADLGLFLGPMLGGVVIKGFEGGAHVYASMYLTAMTPIAVGVVAFLVLRKYIKKNIAANRLPVKK